MYNFRSLAHRRSHPESYLRPRHSNPRAKLSSRSSAIPRSRSRSTRTSQTPIARRRARAKIGARTSTRRLRRFSARSPRPARAVVARRCPARHTRVRDPSQEEGTSNDTWSRDPDIVVWEAAGSYIRPGCMILGLNGSYWTSSVGLYPWRAASS